MAIVIGTAIGYYVTDPTDSDLYFAVRFASALDFHAPSEAHDVRAIIVASPSAAPGIGPFNDAGLVADLDAMVVCNPSMRMHIFTNNYTPVAGSSIGDFTEASWLGYAAQTLTSWEAAAIIATNLASKRSEPVTFEAHT